MRKPCFTIISRRVSLIGEASPTRVGRKRRRREEAILSRSSDSEFTLKVCRKPPRLLVLLALIASLTVLVVQAPTSAAYLPSSNIRRGHRHPFRGQGPSFENPTITRLSFTRASALQVSSIKSWFSMADTRKRDGQKANGEPIFFKRTPSRNESKPEASNKTVNLEGDLASLASMDTSITTWANLLNDDNGTSSTVASSLATAGNMSSASATGKRQAIQNGIFDPTSTLWHFPEYTSTWANTFTTLHDSTLNIRNRVTSPPMEFSPNATARRSLSIPAHLKPEDTLTVADLQAILQASSPEVTAWALSESMPKRPSKNKSIDTQYGLPLDNASPAAMLSQPGKTKKGVAFPQASVLNYKSLRRGTTFTSAIIGMLLATTLLPNLWLMGLLVGGVYGYELCSHPDEPPPSNLVARILIQWGRQLATAVLSVMDSCRTLWFLYKTGELSYQYYKRYEVMDQRFAIQAKMDAWNIRFQEGKMKFDQWERENEIGRTVLAGLRTLWLVDERSRRRAQKSRYRVVQSLYDGKYWVTRWVRKSWKKIHTSSWSASLQEYWKGISTDLLQGGGTSWGTRLGAVMATLIAVNITGALFAISPTFLAIIAIAIGIAWPSWVSELTNRLNVLTLETRARGRGDESALQQLWASAAIDANTAKLLGRYDKEKYHFFRLEDGSKRYYRTGQSLFTGRHKKATGKKGPKVFPSISGTSRPFTWPWAKPQRVRRSPGKEQWGLFSR